MKTLPEDVLRKPAYASLRNLVLICDAMEEYSSLQSEEKDKQLAEATALLLGSVSKEKYIEQVQKLEEKDRRIKELEEAFGKVKAELFEYRENDFERYPLPICFEPMEERKELWRRKQQIKADIESLLTH